MNNSPFAPRDRSRRQATSLAELASLTKQPIASVPQVNLPNVSMINKVDPSIAKNAEAQAYADYMNANPSSTLPEGTPPEMVAQFDENRMMMGSSIPSVQAEGAKRQSALREKLNTPKKRGAAWQYATDLGFTENTPPHRKAMREYTQKNQTNINLNDNKVVTAADLAKFLVRGPDGEWVPPKPGITYAQLYQMESKIKDESTTDTAGKFSMLSSASDALGVVKSNLFNEDGSVNQGNLKGSTAIDAVSGIPLVGAALGQAAKSHFGAQAGQLNNALEVGMQAITRTETGAAMASEEISNTKARFMPKWGDSDELIKQKVGAYEKFLSTAMSMIRDRSTSGKRGELTKKEIKDLVDKSLLRVSEDGLSPGGEPWDEE